MMKGCYKTFLHNLVSRSRVLWQVTLWWLFFSSAITSQLQSGPAAPSPVPACWAPSAHLVSVSGFAAALCPLALLVGAQFPLEQVGMSSSDFPVEISRYIIYWERELGEHLFCKIGAGKM